MACGTLVIWSRVPVGSIFKIRARGDVNLFNALAGVVLNGQSRPMLRHDDIVPGPAEIAIDGPRQKWIIRPTVILTGDPDQPIELEAWLEDTAGNVVQVPDGADGLEDARCQWSIDEDALSPLAIRLLIRSGAA